MFTIGNSNVLSSTISTLVEKFKGNCTSKAVLMYYSRFEYYIILNSSLTFEQRLIVIT